jgi:hypothetical protein
VLKWTAHALLILATLGLANCAEKVVKEPEPQPDRDWVEQVARDHNHEVLKCYEDRLKTAPQVKGDLTLILSADATGLVTSVNTLQTLDTELDDCVIKKAKSWRFPWIKEVTRDIVDPYHLYLNAELQPTCEYESPIVSTEETRQVVRSHAAETRQCYLTRLHDQPELTGRLVMEWDLGDNGEVTKIRVKQPFDSLVDHCVSEKLKTWKFQAPAKDKKVSVSYPFFFTPR